MNVNDRWTPPASLSFKECLKNSAGMPPSVAAAHLAVFLQDANPAISAEAWSAIDRLLALIEIPDLRHLENTVPASWWPFKNTRSAGYARSFCECVHRGPDGTVGLGLASCHSSGYVREEALRRIEAECYSGREIPFLLMRIRDWVPAIRRRAVAMIESRLVPRNRRCFAESAFLVQSARAYPREDFGHLFDKIGIYLAEDLDVVLSSRITPDRARIDLLTALDDLSDADGKARIAESLMCMDGAAARLRVAYWLTGRDVAPEVVRFHLPRILSDKLVGVRRAGLAWCGEHEYEKHAERIRLALFDRSKKIREFAQFYVAKDSGLDPSEIYRDVIRRPGDESKLRCALRGLGETGVAADAEVVRPHFQSPDSGVRKAALAALAALDIDANLELAVTALGDVSPGVSLVASRALNSHATKLGGDRLQGLFRTFRHRHSRIRVVQLLEVLSPWQGLPVLLEILPECDATLAVVAIDKIQRRFDAARLRYGVLPSKEAIDRMKRALDAARLLLPEALRREVESHVNSLAPR